MHAHNDEELNNNYYYRIAITKFYLLMMVIAANLFEVYSLVLLLLQVNKKFHKL